MTATTDPNQLLTTEQAAQILGLRPQTLALWRSSRRHELRYLKVGRLVRYRRGDLEHWLDSRASHNRLSTDYSAFS